MSSALIAFLLVACSGVKAPGSDDTATPGTATPGTTETGTTTTETTPSGTPAPDRPEEPETWAAPGVLDSAAFPWGPQLGDPVADGGILSVRTDLDSAVAVVMADDGAGGWTEVARPALKREADAIVARATLSGLAADTVHNVAVYAEDPDLAGARSTIGRFRTATDGSSHRRLTVATTSCLGGNEPVANMSHVAALDPDLTLLLGDTVYADGADNLEEYRTYWAEAFTLPGLLDTTGGSGVVAAWDDHEVDNNYVVADLAPGRYDAALQAFRESMPQGQGPTGAVWRHVSWGAIADVFVLDVRGERDEDAGLYIGQEQEAWLLEQLSASPAAFKLVITTVPITDYDDFLGVAGANDRWQGWPEQRTRVLNSIEAAGVQGVLWLGGDVHFATVSTLGIPGSGDVGEDSWEVTVGPAGRSQNVAAELYDNDGSHYRVLFSTYNTALLTLDPGTMTVDVQYVGDSGETIAELTVAL